MKVPRETSNADYNELLKNKHAYYFPFYFFCYKGLAQHSLRTVTCVTYLAADRTAV